MNREPASQSCQSRSPTKAHETSHQAVWLRTPVCARTILVSGDRRKLGVERPLLFRVLRVSEATPESKRGYLGHDNTGTQPPDRFTSINSL
jgi:hypothetical protein